MTYAIACRVYLGQPARGRDIIVRGVCDDAVGSVVARLRRIGPLCWFTVHPEK